MVPPRVVARVLLVVRPREDRAIDFRCVAMPEECGCTVV